MKGLTIFTGIIVFIIYCGGTKVPKILHNNKQIFLGIFIGFIISLLNRNNVIEGNGKCNSFGECFDVFWAHATTGIHIDENKH